MKNPVAKFSPEFNKPKVFRDRKKHPSKKEVLSRTDELHHPAHRPYEKEHKNWTKEALLYAEDDFDSDVGPAPDETDGDHEGEPNHATR